MVKSEPDNDGLGDTDKVGTYKPAPKVSDNEQTLIKELNTPGQTDVQMPEVSDKERTIIGTLNIPDLQSGKREASSE